MFTYDIFRCYTGSLIHFTNSSLVKYVFFSSEASPAYMFDVKTCQRKLAEHYQKTAKVPTTAWSSVLQVDLEQIYTRLSWVKQEQTTAGPSQKELNHYAELFTEKTKNGVVAKRILVQGETGIGKTTFVKKLLVDWSNLEEANMNEESNDALRKFDLVVSINLKEVSKCQTFKEVISRSRLFPEDDENVVDDLLCYIRKNQDKVLLVFDGYDEYRTGSEAEERYGSRDDSPIFEIFHGSILRECTVLVTTRSSRADEIRGPADIKAEITGFNMADRKDFMRKMLGSETEVDDLLTFLCSSGMDDLARVPLLSLFFCLLWEEEKRKLVERTERKTKLYQAIVKHILQHSHRRHSSSTASKLNETDSEEILAEIGKVALAGLLKGDLVFKFGQLPERVRGEEGVIVGLFQFSEYGPSLQPIDMVSFIHKSIQEYLAAWYLVYSCVPKGNLGEIEQHGATLEDCEALENVFQFVCGLSDDGAIKVLEHLKSVRISDPALDLSKTIPDIERETDMCPYVVTKKHDRFSDLVYDSFREVQSKAGLLDKCLDCTGGVILVTRDTLLPELIPDVNVLTKLARNLVFILGGVLFDSHGEESIMYKSLKFLDCLQLPVRISESSDGLKVKELITKLRRSIFDSIICLRNGRFQFYITELLLHCDDAKLFEQSTSIDVPSGTTSLCSQQSCLKFLTVLSCCNLSDQTVKALGGVIRSCKHLYRIEVEGSEDSMCYLLEQVQNPSKCSVAITTCLIHPDGAVDHTSPGAVQLASLVPRFYSVDTLYLDVRDCCAAALATLVTNITHKPVKELTLSGIRMTPAAAGALGQSLPEMSSLQVLAIYGMDGSILQAEEMKALFGTFYKRVPLYNLSFCGFSEISCLASFNKSLRYFPNLRELHLGELNVSEHDLCGLLESWSFIRNLKELHLWGNQPGRVYFSTLPFSAGLTLRVNLTLEVAKTLGRILPEMSSLQTLSLSGMDESILQNEEMEALFEKLHTPLPLHNLDISSYNLRGSLAPLIKSLHFFPSVMRLELYKLNMDEDDQCGLLESLKLIPDLTSLRVQSKPLVQGDCGAPILTYTSDSSALRSSKSLNLHGISLTPATIASLGRSLPEMLFLETLELTGRQDGRILQAEETEALFGGISKVMPLSDLNVFSGFSVIGSIAPLTNSFCFFPNLARLCLVDFNMDEHNLCSLLESLQFTPKLMELKVYDGGIKPEHCRTTIAKPVSGFTHKSLRKLELIHTDLTPAVAVVLGRLLPEMLSLQNLRLQGLWFPRNDLKVGMEALFGRFNKRLPLVELDLCFLGTEGCPVAPAAKSFRFFPDLEQLNLREFVIDEHNLLALFESLKFLPILKELKVEGHAQFFPVKVDTLPGITHNTLEQLKLDGVSITPVTDTLPSITHNSLEQLKLYGISLTPVTAALVGRLLSEVSSLETIELTGVYGSILQAVEMEALFCGFNKTLPLHRVTLRNFNVKGCLAKLCKGFHAFSNLKTLKLENIRLSELDQCSLLESLRFIRSVRELNLKSKRHDQRHAHPYLSFTLEAHERLHLADINLTPSAAKALGRSIPEMSSLQVLQLTGVCSLQADEIEALFGGFYKRLPLCELTLSGFSVRGCLSPLIKSLHFFSSLKELKLENLVIDEHDQCNLLKSFGFIRNLTRLVVRVSGEKCLDSFPYYASGLKAVVSHAQNRVDLHGINLTPAVAVVLGQLLREMSFLQELTLEGTDGSVLGAEEMEALFGGLNKILPLYRLIFSGFSVRGSFASLHKSFRFFPSLKELQLSVLNLNEYDLRGLLESFQFIPNLKLLNLSGNPVGHALLSIVPHVINLKKLQCLWIDQSGLAEEDLIYIRDAVQQARPGIHVEGAKTRIRVYCSNL